MLALVLLLSLTGVAEDGGIDISIATNDVDEMVLPSVEVLPGDVDGIDLSIEIPVDR